MHARLKAGTDGAVFVLFDPKALPAEEVDPKQTDSTLKNAALKGKIMGYSFAADGDSDLLVLVDEPPEDRFISRRDETYSITAGYLDVPSGRLVYTGIEDLTRSGERRYSPEGFTPEVGQECKIPVGHYRVDAFEVDWGEEVEEKISRQAIEGDERVETILGTSMGCVVFGTIFGLPGGFLLFLGQVSLSAALKFLLYVGIFEVVFWSVMVPIVKKSKAWKRMHELRAKNEKEHPWVVVQLTSIDHPPTDFEVGLFGEGMGRLKG